MGFWNNKEDKEKEKLEVEETEEIEEDDEVSTYEMNITCENCESDVDVEIPCGTTVNEFLAQKKCEVCECPLRQE